MATKPTSADFTFATDATFSSGDASGNPTKVAPAGWPSNLQGFVPGLKYVSEFRNYLWNVMGQWTGWLAAGSSAGAADAHIVETDSNGDTAVQGLDVAGNAVVAGLLAADGPVYVRAAITPTAMGTTENDYAPTGLESATVLRLTGDASGTDLTGLDAGEADAKLVILQVIGGGTVTLQDESGSSAAINRFAIPAPIPIAVGECAILLYDDTAARWRVLAAP